MNRSTDLNSLLDGEAASQPQHFCSVRLTGKVSQTARVRILVDVKPPSENCLNAAMQHRVVHGSF